MKKKLFLLIFVSTVSLLYSMMVQEDQRILPVRYTLGINKAHAGLSDMDNERMKILNDEYKLLKNRLPASVRTNSMEIYGRLEELYEEVWRLRSFFELFNKIQEDASVMLIEHHGNLARMYQGVEEGKPVGNFKTVEQIENFDKEFMSEFHRENKWKKQKLADILLARGPKA